MQQSVFDQLSATLSNNERQIMLQKAIANLQYKPSLVDQEKKQEERPTLAKQRASLSLFDRIMVFLSSVLGHTPPDEAFINFMLNRLCKEVIRSHSHFINFEKVLFLSDFCTSLQELNEAISVFKQPLNDALVERRAEFYAILAGLENPTAQQLLFDTTDPEKVLERYPTYNNNELLSTIENNCNDLLRRIKHESRIDVVAHTRCLAHLERLTSFNFEKCFAHYNKDGSCPANYLLKSLDKLDNILFSFIPPKSLKMIETLFLFSYQSQGLEEQEMMNRLSIDMKKAVTALHTIEKFSQFPLTHTLKILHNNYFYAPTLLSGGEEWFNVYQRFWQNRADRSYKYFITVRKQTLLKTQILETLKLTELPLTKCYSSTQWPIGFNPTYQYSIGLIDNFMNQVYPQFLTGFLTFIESNGIFYKKDNKADFNKMLQQFVTLEQTLTSFNGRLNNEGDIYTRFVYGIAPSPEVEQSREVASNIANQLATSLLQGSIETLRLFSLILDGLANGLTFDTHYDTLMNFDELLNRNPNLKNTLVKAHTTVRNFTTHLVDMKDTEERLFHLKDHTKALLASQLEDGAG